MLYHANKEDVMWYKQGRCYVIQTRKMLYDANKKDVIWCKQGRCYMIQTRKMLCDTNKEDVMWYKKGRCCMIAAYSFVFQTKARWKNTMTCERVIPNKGNSTRMTIKFTPSFVKSSVFSKRYWIFFVLFRNSIKNRGIKWSTRQIFDVLTYSSGLK